MLKATFFDLMARYAADHAQAGAHWQELERLYGHKGRYYHSLGHLEHLLSQLMAVKAAIQDWDAVLFALYYHDAVYNPLKKDNEARSAVLAEKRLLTAGAPALVVEKCSALILATKNHELSTDPDINYFTDADLSVLGQEWEVYAVYCRQVRKEYAVFPDLLYKPGRAKVLAHFLQMDRIFKTDYFFEKLEARARENLQWELETS